MDIFASDEDRYAYLDFLLEEAKRFGLNILAWQPKRAARRETIYSSPLNTVANLTGCDLSKEVPGRPRKR